MPVPFRLIPDRIESSIYNIDLAQLTQQGVRLLLLDLDNTIARYGQPEPDEALRRWGEAAKAQGLTLFVLSNGRRPARSKRFCESWGVPYLSHAGKPKTRGFAVAMERMSATPQETVILGDQIFTDIWGGHNAGLRGAILVRPIALDNPFRVLRYGVESPFRGLCKLRGDRI
jgi:hypothetical protein